MDKNLVTDLRLFLSKASQATYASGGGETTSQRTGFKELEYREGDWYYRDSYTGSLRSWGQEVIWQNDRPVWVCSYGGGMTDGYMDNDLAKETFSFLKKALSAQDKQLEFQPRGPVAFNEEDWEYHCDILGDISNFTGHEYISYKGDTVFIHDFLGGIIVPS